MRTIVYIPGITQILYQFTITTNFMYCPLCETYFRLLLYIFKYSSKFLYHKIHSFFELPGIRLKIVQQITINNPCCWKFPTLSKFWYIIYQKYSLFTDFPADMKNSWVHWSTSGTHIKKFSLHWVGVLPLYPIWWVYKAIGGGVRWVVVVNVWR